MNIILLFVCILLQKNLNWMVPHWMYWLLILDICLDLVVASVTAITKLKLK